MSKWIKEWEEKPQLHLKDDFEESGICIVNTHGIYQIARFRKKKGYYSWHEEYQGYELNPTHWQYIPKYATEVRHE